MNLSIVVCIVSDCKKTLFYLFAAQITFLKETKCVYRSERNLADISPISFLTKVASSSLFESHSSEGAALMRYGLGWFPVFLIACVIIKPR